MLSFNNNQELIFGLNVNAQKDIQEDKSEEIIQVEEMGEEEIQKDIEDEVLPYDSDDMNLHAEDWEKNKI